MGGKRKAVLGWGPIGTQRSSEASRKNFFVLGFAGNTADDHIDHLYALDRWYALALPPPQPRPSGKRPFRKPAADPVKQ